VNQAAIFRWTRDSITGPPHITGHSLVDLPSKDGVLDVFALEPIVRHLLFRMGGKVIVAVNHLLPDSG
jgi:hypothetical protein